MVRLEDLRKLVEDYHLSVGSKGKAKRKDQLLIDAVYHHYRRVKSEEDDNVLEHTLPISREDLIFEVWRELKVNIIKSKRRSFETTKCTINTNLEKMEGKGLNPKKIRINTTKTKGFGETGNYFILANQRKEVKRSRGKKDIGEFIESYLKEWEYHDYDIPTVMPKKDFINIEKRLNHDSLKDSYIALMLATAIYYGHHYRYWTLKSSKNKEVITYIVRILNQPYRRPFWRTAFILQYVDQDILSEVLAESKDEIRDDEHIKNVLQHIKNKTVKKYLEECAAADSLMVGEQSIQLQYEFFRPWKTQMSKPD